MKFLRYILFTVGIQLGCLLLVSGNAFALEWAAGYPKFVDGNGPSNTLTIIASDGTLEAGKVGIAAYANGASNVTYSVVGVNRFLIEDNLPNLEVVFGGDRDAGSEDIGFALNANDFSTANTTHTITVQAKESDTSIIEATLQVIVDGQAPKQVLDLGAVDGNGYILLTWSPPSNSALSVSNTEHNIDHYVVYYADQQFLSADITDDTSVPVVTEADILDPSTNSLLTGNLDIETETIAVSDALITNYKIEGLENGSTYYFTINAVDLAGNESGIPLDEDNQPYTVFATPDTYGTLMSLAGFGTKDGGFGNKDHCFLVTASLGNKNSIALQPYRFVRDYILLQFSYGQQLVHWYYLHGPAGADWLRNSPRLLPIAFVLAWLGAIMLVLVPFVLVMFLGRLGLRAFRTSNLSTVASWLVVLLAFGLIQPSRLVAEDSGTKLRPHSQTHRFGQQINLNLGPYRPSNIHVGGTSYDQLYSDNDGLMIRAGYGWEMLRMIGILSLNGNIGFWQRQGSSVNSAGNPDASQPDQITLMPAELGLQYALQYIFPQYLVPVVEVGGAFWGIEGAPSGGAERIQSFMYGWYARAELRIWLNWMDKVLSLQMKDDYAIFDTNLVVGIRSDMVSNFRARTDFNLSQEQWYAGINFQF